jgi:hypothetical protein
MSYPSIIGISASGTDIGPQAAAQEEQANFGPDISANQPSSNAAAARHARHEPLRAPTEIIMG